MGLLTGGEEDDYDGLPFHSLDMISLLTSFTSSNYCLMIVPFRPFFHDVLCLYFWDIRFYFFSK